jgi:putative heme-binding domain-containing protein
LFAPRTRRWFAERTTTLFDSSVLILLALLAQSVPVAAFAQRGLKDIPDPDPEIERRSFQVADGFEVNLFAGDPMLAKPIQMNWDSAGRLWIASSEVYPQIQPGQVANDKIIVLEDADGDGRADKTTVFADGLLIPTGIEPGDGGAYVANSTELIHLKDTDGDGKADASRVVLSGFGTEDTHHIIHTFRWGPDGMLYFNQSIYIHSHIETPWGVRRLGGGGIWQFRPETMQLEVFARGFVNTWGHHFDRWGQSFATDGAFGEGINYVFPGATFFSAPGATRILRGLNPGSPKHCGLEIASGRHLPDGWQGNMLTNDFRGNRVCRFVVTEDGSGFASREQPELIKTTHVAFRPIDIKMGPDGAIYIADWYNPIIQHGEVDFRDPRRDHVHGRIWRVTAKGRPVLPRPKLVGASIEALLDALKSPEDWTRHHAKRVLKERGPEVVPALASWVGRIDPTAADAEHHRLEALWTYQSLDVVEPKLLGELLGSPNHRVRAAATRVLSLWHKRLPGAAELLAARATGEHPRVRLEAVRGLSQIPSIASAAAAMRALDQPADQFLDYALWLAARELEPHWLPAVRAGTFDFGGKARHQLFALQSVGSPAVVAPLVAMLQAGRVPADSEESALTLIGSQGQPPELAMVFEMAVADGDAPAARRTKLLAALTKATEQRRVRPAGDLGALGQWLDARDPNLRETAIRAAGRWQIESLRPRLVELARSADIRDDHRHAAFDAVASLGGPASRQALAELCRPPHPAAVRQMAIAALARLDLAASAREGVELLAETKLDADAAAIVTSFLERKGGSAALAGALSDRTLPTDVAKIGVRLARASGRDESPLVNAFSKAGNLDATTSLSADELREMVAQVAEAGDAPRGELVFRRKELNCLKCHSIAGAGGLVGPDLVSIGASAPVDYLIESLVVPNKAVKEGYHSLIVATNDGRVLTGIKVRQSDSELVLRNAENREVAIALSSIEEQKPGGSIMPDGLASPLTRAELIDLVRFMSELGKVGPYSVSKARLARRWQVLEATPAAAEHIRHAGLDAAASADERLRWAPAYSTVAGALPLDAMEPIAVRFQSKSYGFARCHLTVTTPGAVIVRLGAATGLKVWLDGKSMPAAERLRINLSSGQHTLTIAVDLDDRRDGLTCELDDEPGSPAQVQFVGGS